MKTGHGPGTEPETEPDRTWKSGGRSGRREEDMALSIPERMAKETGRDYALRTLRENIIGLELAPGSMVSENELSAQMGLSRTPVREALIELSKVKIVEIWPQRGSAIALIDYDLVEEAQFLRKVLECAVAELCCGMAGEEDIRLLRENIVRQKLYEDTGATNERFLALDNDFHAMLFRIAKKSEIHAMMGSLAIHFDRVRNLTLEDVNLSNVIRDHVELTDAVEAGDGAAARRIMELHLSRFRVAEKQVRDRFPQYFK